MKNSHFSPGSLYSLCVSIVTLTWFSFVALPAATAQVDLDSDDDGLLDAWELLHFGVLNDPEGDPGNDLDGDGRTNLEECNAGTDPDDPTDCLAIVESTFDLTNTIVTWPSVRGKRYHIQISSNLIAWDNIERSAGVPLDFFGSGGDLVADFSGSPAAPTVTGALTREFWTGLTSVPTGDLVPHFNGLGAIDGREWRSSTKGASNDSENFSSRYRGSLQVKPGQGGNYTFYIASRGPGEFHLDADGPGAGGLSRVCYLHDDNVVDEEDWDYLASNGQTDTQKSASFNLQPGTLYAFQMLHVAGEQFDHVAVAWEGPGTSGIEIIPGECLVPAETMVSSNGPALLNGSSPKFARVITHGPLDPNGTGAVNPEALDTDGDGVADDVEDMLDEFHPFLAQSASPSIDDGTYLELRGTANPVFDSISVNPVSFGGVFDIIAREHPGLQANGVKNAPDVATLRVERGGSLVPKTIYFKLSTTTLPTEGQSSPGDYVVQLVDGTPVPESLGVYALSLPFGADSALVQFNPVLDEVVEYPELVTLTLEPSPDYDIAGGGTETRDVVIHDAPDDPIFDKYYIGEHSPEPAAATEADNPVGAAFLILNGSNTVATIDNQYGTFDPGNDEIQSHVHRATISGSTIQSGPVVHTIAPTSTSPDRYLLEDHIFNINTLEATSLYTVQDLIDSLEFDNAAQFGGALTSTPPLYINVHTDSVNTGQIWAIFRRADASTEAPATRLGPTPPIEAIDAVAEEDKMRREIRRFLTQATFGPTPQTEEELYQAVIDAGGDRMAAYDQWITDQWALPMTSCEDLVLAMDMQEWELRGYWNSAEYETGSPPNFGGYGQPPSNWPDFTGQSDRSAFESLTTTTWRKPQHEGYPLDQSDINDARGDGTGEINYHNRRRAQWFLMTQARDELRQRAAFALNEIMVISADLTDVRNHHLGAARWIDMLAENADDHFRQLLEDVTYSPLMGKYLSHLNNASEAYSGVEPDENYAREIMQLFSIGLLELWDDGFIKLDPAGKNIVQTYGNPEITALARIMTGLTYSTNSTNRDTWGEIASEPANQKPNIDRTPPTSWFGTGAGNKYYSSKYLYPMGMTQAAHDDRRSGNTGPAKVIAGGKNINVGNPGTDIPETQGDTELWIVHDYFGGTRNRTSGLYNNAWSTNPLINHPNTPAFISRRLIQRLVTSNPSPDYVYRVASVFKSTNGQLDEVIRTILLDPEARNITAAETDPGYGKRKEPLVAFVQAIRALNARSHLAMNGVTIVDPAYAPYDLHVFEGNIVNDGKDPRVFPNTTLTEGGAISPVPQANIVAEFEYPLAQFQNLRGAIKYDAAGQMKTIGLGIIENHPPTQLRFPLTDTSTTTQLRQTPLRAPTVFNWFLPDYQPGGLISSYGLYAPEFQIADETSVIQNVNIYWTFGWGTTGFALQQFGGNNAKQVAAGYDTRTGTGNYFDEHVIADFYTWANKYINYPDIPDNGITTETERDLQLVHELDDLLCAGRMKLIYPFDPADDGTMVMQGNQPHYPNRNPLESIVWTMTDSYGNPNPPTQTNTLAKVRLAFYLILSSPEYLTQK